MPILRKDIEKWAQVVKVSGAQIGEVTRLPEAYAEYRWRMR